MKIWQLEQMVTYLLSKGTQMKIWQMQMVTYLLRKTALHQVEIFPQYKNLVSYNNANFSSVVYLTEAVFKKCMATLIEEIGRRNLSAEENFRATVPGVMLWLKVMEPRETDFFLFLVYCVLRAGRNF